MQARYLCGGLTAALLVSVAEAQQLEELVVSARHDTRTIDVADALSINAGYQLDADIQAANDRYRIKIGAMTQHGDDAEFDGGEILPSSYERERYDIGYGFKLGDHSFQLDYGYNDTGPSGTPALPMDIDYFTGDLYEFSYAYASADGLSVTATLYGSDLDHGMTNYHLRPPPPDANRRHTPQTLPPRQPTRNALKRLSRSCLTCRRTICWAARNRRTSCSRRR